MAKKIIKTNNKWIIQLLFTIIQIKMAISNCPRLCECKWKNGKEAVTCLNSNFSKVPLELDAGTQVLDLSDNLIGTVKNLEFSSNGLVNLQKIFLNKNKLKVLEKMCFRDLINLVELDLSQNLITQIPTEVFESIPELRELKLSGNPIQKIHKNAFKPLPQLVRLEMSQCRILTVDPKAFNGVEKSLSWLKLDGNRLIQLDSKVLTPLENLHGLELFGNPWNCSCTLRPLRHWLISKNLPSSVSPTCKSPYRLAQKSWDKLDLDEYACLPKIQTLDTPIKGVEGKNISLSCRIEGVPLPHVRWTHKNKPLSGKKYFIDPPTNFSILTIFSAEIQDSGVYSCIAENKAGKVESSLSLLVSKKDPEPPLGAKSIVLVVLLSTFLVVMSSLGVMFFLSFQKKRSKARWQNRRTSSGRRIEDHYEKIEMGHFKIPEANGQIRPHPGDTANTKKNGDYLKIPCLDSEMEMEGEHETFEEDVHSNVNNGEQKLWNSIGRNVSSPNGRFWQSNLEEGNYDPNDLHIPRRSKQDSRDIQPNPSTYGTYEETSTPSTISTLNQSYQSHLMYKVAEISGNNLYSSAIPAKEISNKLIQETNTNAQTTTENSGNHDDRNCNNRFVYGSENNLNNYSNFYGTLPKKQTKHKVGSSQNESQSPLLPGSRYGSDNSECYFTNRRFSEEAHNLGSPNNNFGSSSQKSRSSLNLYSLPQNPNKNLDTPLLDFSNLESRLGTDQSQPKPSQYQLSTYDYHAIQLERFLEEYRTLQEELNRMKETCDNICKNKSTENKILLNNSKFLDPLLHNNDENNKKPNGTEGNSNLWSRNRLDNYYES